MTFKVVYNSCYGGFNLSVPAVQLGRTLSGNPQWAGIMLKGESDWPHEMPCYPNSDLARHDPILVQVVETLGVEASSGYLARLAIAEVGGRYLIAEHDGLETVVQPHDLEWIDPAQKRGGH